MHRCVVGGKHNLISNKRDKLKRYASKDTAQSVYWYFDTFIYWWCMKIIFYLRFYVEQTRPIFYHIYQIMISRVCTAHFQSHSRGQFSYRLLKQHEQEILAQSTWIIFSENVHMVGGTVPIK